MHKEAIAFRKTGFFSPLICDYIDQKHELSRLFNRFPRVENFKDQIQEKKDSKEVSSNSRNVLVSVLKHQYEAVITSELAEKNIDSLESENTFTITTGHQLNLFTGPLYFLYKIISAINLSRQLKQSYPDFNFVPVYWMATEDHDFDEINYFNFKGKKFKWNREATGAVGELATDGLDAILELFSQDLGASQNAKYLKQLFEKTYLKYDNLSDAIRYLANELFKDYGLVIIDANDKKLKRLFIPHVEKELLSRISYKEVSRINSSLESINNSYKIQVNPREINLFYLQNGLRERIIIEDDIYKVVNTNISWTENEILAHLNEAPERFSPNVIMRPLYQEVILPNLCYIGGGGELAYWLQLKNYFNASNVTYPMLLLRNSVLIKSESQSKKLENLNISSDDVFLDKNSLINKKIRQISNINIDFSEQKEHLIKQFEDLYKLAEKTDKSFLGALKAQEVKQLKGLERLEKRLLKAQKRKLSDEVSRMVEIKNELFPNGNLQERTKNFSEFYLEYGEMLIPKLFESLDPLEGEFSILEL